MNNEEKIANEIKSFKQVLSSETLESLAREYGAEDKRRRVLTLEPFFWLMILIRNNDLGFGGLGQAVALFCVVASKVLGYAIKLSRMAISKQMRKRKWEFFQGVLEHLQAHYPEQVPSLLKKLAPKLKEWALVDSTAIDVARILKKRFTSTKKGKAQLKLHVVFSAFKQIPEQLKTTAQKCNDKCFRFVKKAKDLLYIFDLGYWSYPLMDKIRDAGSHFVSRLRNDCDPVIVKAEKKSWVGKKLSEILPLIKGKELDLTVHLAKFRSNPMKNDVRLVGQKYKGEWYLYVTSLIDPIFTPLVIRQIYTVRWQIELLFNDLKHVVNVDHIFSRSVQGIQVEIFSALIYYTLARIVMALAAKQTGQPIEHFSFRRCMRIVKNVLTQTPQLLVKNGKWDFSVMLQTMVQLVILNGLKDKYYIENYIGALAWSS